MKDVNGNTYAEQRIQAARSAAVSINNYIDDVQLFTLNPSNTVGVKGPALQATMRIRRLSSAIIAMSDRHITGSTTVDPQLLTDMMQAVIDGKTDGIRQTDLIILMTLGHKLSTTLAEKLTQKSPIPLNDTPQEAA